MTENKEKDKALLEINKIEPRRDQQSVWGYPRPPRLEDCSKRLLVIFNGVTIADTWKAKRVLETSHPPVYYIPPADIRREHLIKSAGSSYCEWKGLARYYGVVVGNKSVERAAWYYPQPTSPFEAIAHHLAFYAETMDVCYVDGERVIPQPGSFYGGWITKDIVGPFKGEPGTWGW